MNMNSRQRDRAGTSVGCLRHRLRGLAIFAPLAAVLAVSPPAQAGLVIDPIFDGTVTADAQTDINTAIGLFQSQFANTRNNNVTILFRMGAIGGLGQSNGSFYTFGYNGVNGYTTALGTAATNTGNAVITSAFNNLGTGNGAATPNVTKVETTAADARMLNADGAKLNCGACNGIFDDAGNNVGAAGTVDGIITLTTAKDKANKPLLDFKRSDNFASGSFDALRTIEHEIDEILGIGGAGSNLPGNADPSKTIGDMDLFRYGAKGVASLTTDPNATAYFSTDGGTTKVAGFNQGFNNPALKDVAPPNGNCLDNNSCGDFGDWADQTANQGPNSCGFGLVQDAFACPQQNADISLGSAEGIGLQAIGYDPVPEPATIILFASSLLGLGALRRRRSGLG